MKVQYVPGEMSTVVSAFRGQSNHSKHDKWPTHAYQYVESFPLETGSLKYVEYFYFLLVGGVEKFYLYNYPMTYAEAVAFDEAYKSGGPYAALDYWGGENYNFVQRPTLVFASTDAAQIGVWLAAH
jgi:hypothetical protein